MCKVLPESYLDEDFILNKNEDSKPVKISEGSYSDIFTLGNKYVLKRIKNNNFNYLGVITELDILTNLKHKNIVRSYGFVKDHERITFILDRYQTTLDDFKPTITEVDFIIGELKKGLQFMHNNMYLHLDLKPDNILISKYGNSLHVAIADFSLSKKTKDLTFISDSELISLYYRPYENLRGSLLYSNKSDLWSLGIIIYELKSGIKIYERILPLSKGNKINLDTSLLIFLEKQISWGNWPPLNISILNENPVYRNLDSDKFIIKIDEDVSDENIEYLSHLFPVDVIKPFLFETNKLFNNILYLLPNNSNEIKMSWFVACFLIVYSNYNQFTKLFSYLKEYNYSQIYNILSAGLYGKM